MSSKLDNAPAWFVFTLFVLSIAAVIGWFMNIAAIFSLTSASPLGWIVGRVVGVFIPIIGAVLGYI